MLQSTKEDLVKYIKVSSSPWLLVIGAVLVALGIGSLVSGAELYSSPVLSTLMCLFLAGVGIWVIWADISSVRKFKAYIQQAETSGELQVLLADFSRSCSMVGDNIRLGEKYIFGKKKGRPVSYGEIVKVYQHIHKRNFIENSRQLHAVVNGGSICTLCDLKLHGKSDEDVAKIMGYIRYKNPNVHLGYK